MVAKIKNNKFLKISMSLIKTCITIFLVLLVLLILVQKVSNNDFSIGGIRVFTVVTGSMLPEYEIGDMIISIETEPKDIKVGDNIVYKGLVDDFNGKIVTHKVIEKKQEKNKYNFITKGLNNSIEDPEITEDQILGKVVYKTIILSVISKLINNTSTFFFVIFIPFAFLVFCEIIDILEERKNTDDSTNI